MRALPGLLLLVALSSEARHLDFRGSIPSNAATDFTLDVLERLVKEQSIASVDQLLALLPEDFKENYILIRDSGSLQKSTFSGPEPKPRALLYSASGLIVSFTDPKLPGGDAVEILQATADNHWVAAEFKEGRITKNPAKCISCHGQKTRPLWDAYPCWDSAYAADDDRLSDQEREELTRFVESLSSRPRYQILKNVGERYLKSESNSVSARLASQPNINFTKYIHAFDDLRSARLVKDLPHYQDLKFALVASLLNCFGRSYPSTYFDTATWAYLGKYYVKARHTADAYFTHKYQTLDSRRCAGDNSGEPVLFKALIQSMGVSPSEIFTSFDPRDPTFNKHPEDPFRILEVIREITLADIDFLGIDFSRPNPATCATLIVRNRTSLHTQLQRYQEKALEAEAVFQDTAPSTFAKCIVCHVSESLRAPQFPFHNGKALHTWLQDPANSDRLRSVLSEDARRRMPLVGHLQPYERALILEYIETHTQ